MAQYDLSAQVSRYLDKHLVLPLLEFLKEKELYSEHDILKAQLDLIAKTNMVDFAMDIYRLLYKTEDVPDEMWSRRQEVVNNMARLQAEVDPMVQFFKDDAKVRKLRQDKSANLAMLQEEFNLGKENIEALYSYAKFQFECGNYQLAQEYLHHYRLLCTETERNVSALWGKLASEILMQDWESASEDLKKLREVLDNQLFATPLMQVQQRAWLMHWALYIFWNIPDGRSELIDLFFQEKYLIALQINAPHLLRYLAVAVVISKHRSRKTAGLKDLIRLIQSEAYEFRDPITEFLECVYVKHDFDSAQEKLNECKEAMDNDFFLSMAGNSKQEFLENARLYIFETYCRIHQCIDLQMLAGRLGMPQQDAERWIANLIKNARLNAKIDWTNNTIVMGMQYPSTYEQIVDRTRLLSVRTFHIANMVVGT